MEPSDGLPELDTVEQRVIGALMEKQRTVPDTYPMTLNALRTACNQKNSRDPVVDFDDRTVTEAIDRLKARGLARIVYASGGARAVKFRQVLDERIGIDDAERAIVTLLLLRGPQSAGELKTRSERLHPFADRGAVDAALESMAVRTDPLVRPLDRRPGEHDTRWIHALGPVDLSTHPAGAVDVAPTVDRGADALPLQVVLYLGASADDVWAALTDGDLTAAWWGRRNESSWEVGSRWRNRHDDGAGATVVDGEVLEATRPKRLVTTWEERTGPETPPSRVTYRLDDFTTVTRLTVLHEGLEGSTRTAAEHGWPAALSNLKTFLETGDPLPTAPWELPAEFE
ncbi:MAG: DUF480 domain-containing protein [Microthrixaceae bacterium]